MDPRTIADPWIQLNDADSSDPDPQQQGLKGLF